MSLDNKILEIVSEILEVEVEELTVTTELDDASWDSLAVVSFIAEVDSEFNKVLDPKSVGGVTSIAQLVELVK